MDELVRHCLRELSFDGDLGCDVSRLRDFIVEYYSHPSPSQAQGQNVDDAFCALVWSFIVQQPGVRVGIIPPGGSTEVYIAPQASAVRKAKVKAKAKGEEAMEEPEPRTGLDSVPDAAIRPLEDLIRQYGDQLRIAVDLETTFVALTGSHIRPSKLTAMVYTALQIISRGRENGVSVLDLGKKSGYDQKTCFYIIKQLVELGLVVKLRKPGVSGNMCVHKYFYERSPVWQQVVAEEQKAIADEQDKDGQGDSEDDEDEEETKPLAPVHFDPIDSRHLSSMPVLKARLAKLLKNCPHHMHTSNNLMLKIGFVNPTRTDRRFFRTRLRELMEQGFIEKVHVPHANRKRHPDKKIPCIRLITDEEATPVPEEVEPVEDGDIQELEDAEATGTGLKVNVSLHRQIIDCLSEAGMGGMTLNELSVALGNFDKRTVDLLMNRLEKDPPPAHLADLGIAQLAETHGRERRYKYYTVAHYLAIAEKEQFEEQRYRDVEMSAVGGFLPVEPDVFYEDEAELHRRVGELGGLKDGVVSKGKGKGKKHVNPILPDGSVKKGRPRKSMQPEGTTPTPSKKGMKRKRDETEDAVDAESTSEPPPKKKRGRPPKVRPTEDAGADPSASTAPRKRGRSSKKRLDEGEADTVAGPSSVVPESVSQGPAPKKRGRPRKSVAPAAQQAAIDEAERTEDVLMADWKSYSPLSSLTQSPVPEGTAIDVPGAVQAPVSTTTIDHVQPDSSFPNSDASIEPEPAPTASASVGLRRSTRAPKVRKRGDSRSPVRKSPRKPRMSTVVADSASSVAVVPTTFSATQDVVSDPVISPQPAAVETPALTAQHSTLSDSIAMPPPSFVPFYAGLQHDIPIDPALLQGDELSALIQGHSLIAMTPEPEAGPSNATDNSRKRGQSPSMEPLSKRAKSGQSDGSSRFRTKANISQSRRENELLRLLAEADGIMNTSCKEFYEAHAALVEKITQAGESASTRPGARIDKRTLEATLKDLETKGKIKLVTTMAPTLTGSNRMARVAYLPEVSETALQVFLADLGQSLQNLQIGLNPAPVKTFDEPLAYGGGRKLPKGRPSRAREQTDGDVQEVVTMDMAQLFQQNDQKIRDALLSEKNTVAQLYGYIVGRAARARALHSLTVDMLSKGAPSSQIVSHDSRIVHLSYYSTDIPISTYCSLVAVHEPMEELGRLLHSPAGRTTLVRSVPEAVRAALAPAHAKSRTRILSLLELLQTLGLVRPLVPSTSPTPAFTCAPNAEHPTAFDFAPPGAHTTAGAPVYWCFNDTAPIRLWALGEGLPPAWKTVSVATSEQATEFWDGLERASTDANYARVLLGAAPAPSEHATEEDLIVSKTLRRTVSWSSVYNLSLLQTEYLRRYIDVATGNTPLDDPEHGDEQLERLSWIVSASKDVIARWFEKARKKHIRDLKKVKKGKRRADKHEEAGAVLARRAAAAKEQRERDWDAMVARVHPSELRSSAEQRVRRIKAKFIHGSGKASEKWETRIADAIKEADMVAEKLLSTSRAPLFTHTPVAKPAPPAPVVTSVLEADVDDLIASQVPRAVKEASAPKKKKGKKGKEKDTDDVDVKTPRRHRFLWNNQYDELARDASVIIKARCRGPTRLDWGAVEQVFPAVPRNSVRQRLVHMKEDTRVETYLARLEDKWYDLWMQHRGTDELPDPDPESATNFDLRTHIKFLRKHIDKNAIRVGFVEVRANVELPASIDDIEKHFDVAEKVPTAPPWDFMWTVVAEEAREKQFVHNAFTSEVADLPPVTSYDSDFLQVAEAAVKMALGNPTETYEADAGSQFLKAVGEEPVRLTTAELLSRGVLAKMIRDPAKSKPGRALKISDSNQNALGGPLPSELFQDAAALDDLIAQQDGNERGQEWSLLASDGDTAFILELASENKVRFDIDTSHPQSMRAMIDWNSKKADDDDIETAIRIRYTNVAGPSSEPFVTEPIIEPSGSDRGVPSWMAADVSMYMDVDQSPAPSRHEDACEHGQTADGEIAFCRLTSDGLVDCEACLEQAKVSLLRATDGEDERAAAAKVLGALHAAGSKGVTKQELLTKLDPVPLDTLFSVVQRMTDAAAAAPLAYWTGYAAVVLVSAGAIRPWTVTVYNTESADSPGSAERKSMIFPRRWLDIYGRKLSEVWEAALRAVLGLVLLRPGISQADIRWRLRSVYDRDEVCEVLQMLQGARYITPRADRVHKTFDGGPADEEEEKFTFWSLASTGGRRWYQV